MVLTKRLIVDAKTGAQQYVDAEIDLPSEPSAIEVRDIIKECDDLVALLKSKNVISGGINCGHRSRRCMRRASERSPITVLGAG